MQDIINTLLVSCILATITGVVTYLTARRNAKTQIAAPAYTRDDFYLVVPHNITQRMDIAGIFDALVEQDLT